MFEKLVRVQFGDLAIRAWFAVDTAEAIDGNSGRELQDILEVARSIPGAPKPGQLAGLLFERLPAISAVEVQNERGAGGVARRILE